MIASAKCRRFSIFSCIVRSHCPLPSFTKISQWTFFPCQLIVSQISELVQDIHRLMFGRPTPATVDYSVDIVSQRHGHDLVRNHDWKHPKSKRTPVHNIQSRALKGGGHCASKASEASERSTPLTVATVIDANFDTSAVACR